MIFPHANNAEIDDRLFLAVWSLWFRLYAQGHDPLTAAMPRLNQAVVYQELLANVGPFSLDVMCRRLLRYTNRAQYENTMQATNKFLDENGAMLEKVMVINPVTNRNVNGACLTEGARNILSEMLEGGIANLEINA